MSTLHPVRRTASCPACGGPGAAFDPGDCPDETNCTYCGASFRVTRPEWWCDPCGAWLAARPTPAETLGISDVLLDRAHQLLEHRYQLLGLAGRPIGYHVSATCDHPDCTAEINRGLAFLCGDRHSQALLWGCGGFYCRLHLSAHQCTGFEDLSMHSPRVEDGEQVCDWDGDVWPCSPVRAAPDNPTIGRMYGSGAA